MDSHVGRIVIAYDGTSHSQTALDWAAAEAWRRRRPLMVLHVLDFLETIPGPVPHGWWPDAIPQLGDQIAGEGADRARLSFDSIEVSAITRHGPVAQALVEISSEAELLVVGTRGHGTSTRFELGSAAFAISGHAHCPVIVVRGVPGAPPGPRRPVVVGVDGSPDSEPALDYAAEVAVEARAALVIATAYQPRALLTPVDALYSAYLRGDDGGPDPDAPIRTTAEKIASAAASRVSQRHPGLEVQNRILVGAAAAQLSATSRRAGLLVVGSRGHGGFVGLVLGSVSHSVLCSAHCPVAVVRTASQRRSDRLSSATS